MPDYILGRNDPAYISDAGSGEWCSTGHFTNDLYFYKKYLEELVSGSVYIKIRYPYAREHLLHYLRNTGEDMHVNLNDMMEKSNQLENNYSQELAEAKEFCQSLNPGQHDITSYNFGTGDFISSDPDLFYAIGGYQYWGQGHVSITEDEFKTNSSTADRQCSYNLKFQFMFFDRYNWNLNSANSGVRLGNIIPVTDAFMGEFHQQCLAREFNIFGTIETEVKWND